MNLEYYIIFNRARAN